MNMLDWWMGLYENETPHCKHCNSRNVYMAKDGVKYVLKDASTGELHVCPESKTAHKRTVQGIES